jgi:hypothetical protein
VCVKRMFWEEARERSVAWGMPTTLMMNREEQQCGAFLKAEQRASCHILMEVAAGWLVWVRQRRSEVVNWMPNLLMKGSCSEDSDSDDFDSAMLDDSVVVVVVGGGAFAVEKPFCPRGARNNCFFYEVIKLNRH